jgi:hypothetical protein
MALLVHSNGECSFWKKPPAAPVVYKLPPPRKIVCAECGVPFGHVAAIATRVIAQSDVSPSFAERELLSCANLVGWPASPRLAEQGVQFGAPVVAPIASIAWAPCFPEPPLVPILEHHWIFRPRILRTSGGRLTSDKWPNTTHRQRRWVYSPTIDCTALAE